MKAIRFLALILISQSIVSVSFGQSRSKNTIAVLPFHSIGVDEISTQSAESLLKHELEKREVHNLIPEKRIVQILGDEICSEIPCAMEVGSKLKADQAVVCKLVALGEKVIVQYILLNIPDQKVLLLDQITSLSIEDLDVVMKRVAMSIVHIESIEDVAEVDAITEHEVLTPRRRSTRRFAGFSFGYLYPQQGYDGSTRSFTVDFRTGAEIKDYSIGMQLAARKGFGMNIFASYLMTKTDFCPYIGGAFGFHWVKHESNYTYRGGSYYSDEDKKRDGFELTANGGIMAFRTYDIQIIMNLAHLYI